MAKIDRKLMRMFGSEAGTNQVGQFGSLAAGSAVYVNDGNIDTIQSLSNWLGGWYDAVVGNNSPAIQDMNALHYVYAYQLSYLFQAGVPEWNSATIYYVGSLVNDGTGKVYRSLADDNAGNPLTDVSKWGPTATVDTQPPIGSIIAYNPGYFTNGINGSFTLVGPATNNAAGVNAYLPTNWRVCNGAELNDSSSPIFNGAGRYLPNLTDSRFLMGSTASGSIGGSAGATLTEANLPSHTHSINHDHGVFSSLSNSVGHTHGIDHDHGAFNTSSGGSHTHNTPSVLGLNSTPFYSGAAYNVPGGTFYGFYGGQYQVAATDSAHVHSIDVPYYSGTSGGESVTHTHIVDVPNFTGNSGATGAGAPFLTLPTYLSTLFIMRVK